MAGDAGHYDPVPQWMCARARVAPQTRAQRVAPSGSGLPTSAPPFQSWNRRTWRPRVTPPSLLMRIQPGKTSVAACTRRAGRPHPLPRQMRTGGWLWGSWATPDRAATRPRVPRGPSSRGPGRLWTVRRVARYAAFYEFLMSAVEKAIFRQSRDRRIRPRAVYAGWARRNRPKCGTVNAIRPRSEL